MAFFGLNSSLEEERNKFYSKGALEEDVEVYTWGEAGYDGLGDALQEGNDELNDETFGGSDPVGKDFDFSAQNFAPNDLPPEVAQKQHARRVSPQAPVEHAHVQVAPNDPRWDDRNALNAMLSRVGGSNRHGATERAPPMHRTQSSHSSASHHQALQAQVPAEDIQAELLALSMRARQQERSQRNTPRPPMTVEEVEEQLLREQIMRREHEQQQQQQQLLLLHQQQQHEQELLLRQQEMFLQQQRLQQQQQQIQLLQQQQLEYAARHSGHSHTHSRTFSEQALIQQQMQERLHMLRNDTQRQQAQIALQQHPEFLAMDEQQRAAILNEAQRKIMQTEQLEEKRRRRVIKMQRMSKYNDLMTQSDKDFITRIQVSQLVTEDPFVEDYYAQVYSSHFRQNGGEERILRLGSGGVGLGMPGTRAGRRENAMQRMQQQVERIVKHAQQRDKEKATNALHYLQGALGKTAGRSYKAAPRQLLQVDSAANGSASPKKTAGHISKEDAEDPAKNPAVLNAFNEQTTEQLAPFKPLDRHQLLIYIENLITKFLDVELLRRRINADDAQELVDEVEKLAERIYQDLHIVVPLEASEPHPFIALLGPAKGKRMFPRFPGTFDSGQLTNIITLLLATFYQLDVVQNAGLLDTMDDSPEKAEVERQTQVFQECVVQTIGRILATAPLGMVAGLLRVLVSRNVAFVSLSKPGVSLLTELLNRAHIILQTSGPTQPDGPMPEEVQAWSTVYTELFHALADHLFAMFPSVRIASHVVTTNPAYFTGGRLPPHIPEAVDQHVWHFIALLAAHGTAAEHTAIIGRVREKVMENAKIVNHRWVADEEELLLIATDTNLLLHVVGLDISQLS